MPKHVNHFLVASLRIVSRSLVAFLRLGSLMWMRILGVVLWMSYDVMIKRTLKILVSFALHAVLVAFIVHTFETIWHGSLGLGNCICAFLAGASKFHCVGLV